MMAEKSPTRYTARHDARLHTARDEYAALLAAAAPTYTLDALISPKGASFARYCDRFTPNPWSVETVAACEQFARRHGIWLESFSRHYVDMVCYAYPNASRDRLLPIGKIHMVDFYLNDTVGREKVASLDESQQEVMAQAVGRLVLACKTHALPVEEGSTGLDRAHLETLQDIRKDSAPDWYRTFIPLWIDQLTLTHQDRNASALRRVPTVRQYIRERITYSGMEYAVALMEFARGRYVPAAWLETVKIDTDLRRLKWLCNVIAALSNDLFSFEKEVVDHQADSNLVAVLLLNNPEISLLQAIDEAGKIVARYLDEYLSLASSLRNTYADLVVQHPARACDLAALIDSIDSYVKACWAWQTHTGRYRRPRTIFAELLM
jgi:hypothetical protein